METIMKGSAIFDGGYKLMLINPRGPGRLTFTKSGGAAEFITSFADRDPWVVAITQARHAEFNRLQALHGDDRAKIDAGLAAWDAGDGLRVTP
jgi:hypothetical protein